MNALDRKHARAMFEKRDHSENRLRLCMHVHKQQARKEIVDRTQHTTVTKGK
jgi:hypothetical protein